MKSCQGTPWTGLQTGGRTTSQNGSPSTACRDTSCSKASERVKIQASASTCEGAKIQIPPVIPLVPPVSREQGRTNQAQHLGQMDTDRGGASSGSSAATIIRRSDRRLRLRAVRPATSEWRWAARNQISLNSSKGNTSSKALTSVIHAEEVPRANSRWKTTFEVDETAEGVDEETVNAIRCPGWQKGKSWTRWKHSEHSESLMRAKICRRMRRSLPRDGKAFPETFQKVTSGDLGS